MMKFFGVIFREKPAMMLIEMRNSKEKIYPSNLAKKVDCTYSHVVNILQQMEQAGLVNFNKQGRIKLLSLTKKGHDLAHHLESAKKALCKSL